MSRTEWPSKDLVVGTVHRRIVFEDRLATGWLIMIIMLWYLFQILTVFIGWERSAIQWVFTTESFPALSPGLVLAIMSHAFPPRVTHLFSNMAGLWLFAGESEQHMGKMELIGFFILTSLTAVLVGTVVSGGSIMGSSGGVMAFIGFYCVHIVLAHSDELDWDELESKGWGDSKLQALWGLFLVLTPIALFLYMIGQLTGFLPIGDSDVYGHLTGLLVGTGYGVIRPTNSH